MAQAGNYKLKGLSG